VERLVLNGVPWLTAAERAHFAAFEFKPVEPRGRTAAPAGCMEPAAARFAGVDGLAGDARTCG
jgi:hypothetical protein